MLRSVAHLLIDAPADGNLYGRENGTWTTMPTSSGGIPEAPTDGQLYSRRGSTTSWLPAIVMAGSTPASPAVGQMWWDSTDGNTYIYYNDGTSTQWVPAVTSVSSALPVVPATATPPASPVAGQMWWNTNDGNTYIYYNDGTSSQWVPAVTNPGSPPGSLLISGGTMTGPLILNADPTANLGAATKQYVDAVNSKLGNYLLLSGGTLTGALTLSGNAATNMQAVPLQQMNAATALKLNLAGGTLTGPLILNADPTAALGAATKQYVDSKVASGGTGYLPLAGGTLSGPLILNADPTVALGAVTKQYVDGKVGGAGYLALTGGTLTGPLVLNADPTTNLGAATKQYVDAVNTKLGSYLPLAGGVLTGALTLAGNATANLQAVTLQQMNAALALKLNLTGGTLTGPLILQADPTVALGAATKQYVDSKTGGTGYLPLSGGVLTGPLTIPVGTAAAPTLNFTGNTTAGLYAASNLVGISVAGASVMTATPGALTVAGNVSVNGSVTSTGSVQAAVNFTLSNSGASISSDTNATYFFQDTAQWRWQYNRANGSMTYVRGSDGGSLFICDGNGACSAAGSFLAPYLQSNGNINAAGTITSTANGRIIASGTNQPCLSISDVTQGYDMGWWLNAASNPALIFGQTDGNGSPYAEWGYVLESGCGFTDGTVSMACSSGVNAVMWANASSFYVPNGAFKPGGGVWADSSDARIKTVLGDYESGLDAILRLRPVRYRFRGNLRHENGPKIRSGMVGPHDAATDAEYIGLVAQEIEEVMPEMVSKHAGFIDDEPVDDLRMLDMSALPLALVNAVKELTARVAGLEARRQ